MVPWHVLEVLDCLIGLGKYCQGVTGKEDEYGRVSSPCRGVWVGMSLAGRSHLLPTLSLPRPPLLTPLCFPAWEGSGGPELLQVPQCPCGFLHLPAHTFVIPL